MRIFFRYMKDIINKLCIFKGEKQMEKNDKPEQPEKETTSERLRRIQEEESLSKFDKDGKMSIKLTINDSALVVREDGTIEMVSHELEKHEDGFIGDVEDLNKTFSLVLALASALENEDLYNRIYHNLNMSLMTKWGLLGDDIKSEIIKRRRNAAVNRSEEERDEKQRRVDDFRKRMEKFKDQHIDDLDEEKRKLKKDMRDEENFKKQYGEDFQDMFEAKAEQMEQFEEMEQQKRPKMKKKKKLLLPPKGTDWNPYDKTLKAHWKPWHVDEPPPEED